MTDILVCGLSDGLPTLKFYGQNFKFVTGKESDYNRIPYANLPQLADVLRRNDSLSQYLVDRNLYKQISGTGTTFILQTCFNQFWAFGDTLKNLPFYIQHPTRKMRKLYSFSTDAKKLEVNSQRIFLLTGFGKVYAMGRNKHFQIANSPKEMFDMPIPLNLALLNRKSINPAENYQEEIQDSPKKGSRLSKSPSIHQEGFVEFSSQKRKNVKSTFSVEYMASDENGNKRMRRVKKTVRAVYLNIYSNEYCTYYQTKRGVFSQGDVNSKLLGYREIDKLANKPMRIIFPQKTPKSKFVQIEMIATGSVHCLALDSEGCVYSWGKNVNGVLGITKNEKKVNMVFLEPYHVSILRDAKICSIHAADDASFALDMRGRAYFWGRPFKSMKDTEVVFDFVKKLELSTASQEMLGKDFHPIIFKMESFETNYAFLDIQGRLYTMGSNQNGLCGFMSRSKVYEERTLNYVSILDELFITDIRMQKNNLVLLAYPKEFKNELKSTLRSHQFEDFIRRVAYLGNKYVSFKRKRPKRRKTFKSSKTLKSSKTMKSSKKVENDLEMSPEPVGSQLELILASRRTLVDETNENADRDITKYLVEEDTERSGPGRGKKKAVSFLDLNRLYMGQEGGAVEEGSQTQKYRTEETNRTFGAGREVDRANWLPSRFDKGTERHNEGTGEEVGQVLEGNSVQMDTERTEVNLKVDDGDEGETGRDGSKEVGDDGNEEIKIVDLIQNEKLSRISSKQSLHNRKSIQRVSSLDLSKARAELAIDLQNQFKKKSKPYMGHGRGSLAKIAKMANPEPILELASQERVKDSRRTASVNPDTSKTRSRLDILERAVSQLTKTKTIKKDSSRSRSHKNMQMESTSSIKRTEQLKRAEKVDLDDSLRLSRSKSKKGQNRSMASRGFVQLPSETKSIILPKIHSKYLNNSQKFEPFKSAFQMPGTDSGRLSSTQYGSPHTPGYPKNHPKGLNRYKSSKFIQSYNPLMSVKKRNQRHRRPNMGPYHSSSHLNYGRMGRNRGQRSISPRGDFEFANDADYSIPIPNHLKSRISNQSKEVLQEIASKYDKNGLINVSVISRKLSQPGDSDSPSRYRETSLDSLDSNFGSRPVIEPPKEFLVNFEFGDLKLKNKHVEVEEVVKPAQQLIYDPTELQEKEKDEVLFKNFFNYGIKNSKNLYLELVSRGMSKKMLDKILENIWRMHEEEKRIKVVETKRQRRRRLRKERNGVKRFEDPFKIAAEAQSQAQLMRKELIVLCQEFIEGLAEAVNERFLNPKERAKIQQSPNEGSNTVAMGSQSPGNKRSMTGNDMTTSRLNQSGIMTTNRVQGMDGIPGSSSRPKLPDGRALDSLNSQERSDIYMNRATSQTRHLSPSERHQRSESLYVKPTMLRTKSPTSLARQNLKMLGANFGSRLASSKKSKKNSGKDKSKNRPVMRSRFSHSTSQMLNPINSAKKKVLTPMKLESKKKLSKYARMFQLKKKAQSKKDPREFLKKNYFSVKKKNFKQFQLEKLQNFVKVKNERIAKATDHKKQLLKQHRELLVKKFEDRLKKLHEKTRVMMVNRKNNKLMRGMFNVINVFRFFYQIQRLMIFQRNVKEDGFHSQSVATIQRWFNRRKPIKNKKAANLFKIAFVKIQREKYRRKIQSHFVFKAFKKRMKVPMHRFWAKFKKIERFCLQKANVKYFELGLVAVKFKLQHFQNYGMGNVRIEKLENLRVYLDLINRRYAGLEIRLCSRERLIKLYESRNPSLFTEESASMKSVVSHPKSPKAAKISKEIVALLRGGSSSRTMSITDSSFKIFELKLKVMKKVYMLHFAKIKGLFDLRDAQTGGMRMFYKGIFAKAIDSVLPLTKHENYFMRQMRNMKKIEVSKNQAKLFRVNKRINDMDSKAQKIMITAFYHQSREKIIEDVKAYYRHLESTLDKNKEAINARRAFQMLIMKPKELDEMIEERNKVREIEQLRARGSIKLGYELDPASNEDSLPYKHKIIHYAEELILDTLEAPNFQYKIKKDEFRTYMEIYILKFKSLYNVLRTQVLHEVKEHLAERKKSKQNSSRKKVY